MLNRSKIKWIILLAVILLLIPIGAYIVKFSDKFVSANPNDWGPFGDFFGGILNPLISLYSLCVTIYIAYELTRIEDKRNDKIIETTYKPELIIEEKLFYIKPGGTVYSRIPLLYTYDRLTDDETPSVYDAKFGLNVINIGNGPTKRIDIAYEFDIPKIVQQLKAMAAFIPEDTKLYVSWDKERNRLTIKYEYRGIDRTRTYNILPTNEKINYLLHANVNPKPYLLVIPQHILELYSAYIFAFLNTPDSDGMVEAFPDIKITMSYSDIGDKSFCKKCIVSLINKGGTVATTSHEILVLVDE